jgi:hypothetical protein
MLLIEPGDKMMNQRWKLLGIVLVLSALLASCGSAAQQQDTSADPVKITLKTNPPELAVGQIELILDLKDITDQPLTGARVDVSADHTDMSGMTMSGPATEQEDGKYAVTADFSMSGNWKITVYIRKDNLDFKKEIDLKIP